jgi:hypothetical protein
MNLPRRDIDTVLRANEKWLMSLEGVAGIYVGLLDDQQTRCLKVMVARMTPALRRQLPARLQVPLLLRVEK